MTSGKRNAHLIAIVALAAGILIGGSLPFGTGQAGLGQAANAESLSQDGAATVASPPTIVVNITSGPTELFEVVTGLRLATDARAMGRRVIVLFNNAGARVPSRLLPIELRLNNEPALSQMLLDLRAAGVEFIVCDFSARALGIFDNEFVEGTFIAHSNEAVLRRMGPNATVFTY